MSNETKGPQPPAEAQPVAWFPTYGSGELVRNYGDGSPVPASKTKEGAEQAKRCHLGATGPVTPLYAHPPPSAPAGVEGFVVRHYTDEEGPTIKGNGFDGLRVGEDRDEAEGFVRWVNAALAQQPSVAPVGVEGHAKDCLHIYPLPTGEGYWHCTFGYGEDAALAQQPAAELYRCTACDDHYRIGTPCDCKLQPGHPDFTPATQQPASDPRSTHRVWRGDDWLPCYCEATDDHRIGSEQPASVGVPVDAVREYLDARACYEAATRPPNSHARAPVLKHDDPDARRLREARVALDNAIITSLSAPQPPAEAQTLAEKWWGEVCDALSEADPDWMLDGPGGIESAVAMIRKLAARPAEAQPVGEAGTMPGTNGGFTTAVFKAADVPVGTKLYTAPPSAPVGDCPDCTNGEQCAKCSRGEWAGLESSAPVGVEAELKAFDDWFRSEQGRPYDGGWEFGRAAWLHRASLAQQPAAVDEEGVDRAVQAWFESSASDDRASMREAISAYLSIQPGGSNNDR